MSLYSDFKNALLKTYDLRRDLDRLALDVTKLAETCADHEKRLIGIETMIELAAQGRLAPPRR